MNTDFPRQRRVAVTGMGVVCPLGTDVAGFWANCLEGARNIAATPAAWSDYADFKSKIWSPLPQVEFASRLVDSVERKRLDVSSLLYLDALAQAFESARIGFLPDDPKRGTFALQGVDSMRIQVHIGTAVGGVGSLMANHSNHLLEKPLARMAARMPGAEVGLSAGFRVPRRFNPYSASMIMPNAITGNVSIKFGLQGPGRTHVSSCASGTIAIGSAYKAVRDGECDLAVTGAAEYLRDESGCQFRSFDILGVLTQDSTGAYPFDEGRSGFLFCEGAAGALILEDMEMALKRKAPIWGEIVGFAETSDAFNIVRIHPGGICQTRMLEELLDQAHIKPGQIDYVNAHGTGTLENDALEAEVLNRVFPLKPIVNSTKGLTGHSIGASGAIEAVVTLMTLHQGRAHGNHLRSSPIGGLNVPERSMTGVFGAGLSQSFGFGGHNAALAFKPYHRSEA